MATAYRAPIDPPEITTESLIDGSYRQIENDYTDKLAAMARQNGKSDLLGEIIRFPRGDGYAQYMVWNTRPLELVLIETGDAWTVEDALIRGLRVSDVREMVEREKKLAALFS